jgi:hypothetical protein
MISAHSELFLFVLDRAVGTQAHRQTQQRTHSALTNDRLPRLSSSHCAYVCWVHHTAGGCAVHGVREPYTGGTRSSFVAGPSFGKTAEL